MHIHICPAEISAFLMTVEAAVPYVRYHLCHHANCLKEAIMKRLPVTVWNRVNKEGEKTFNHLEEGHVEVDTPTARTEIQKKSWNNSKWEKEYGYLTEDSVVVGEEDDESI